MKNNKEEEKTTRSPDSLGKNVIWNVVVPIATSVLVLFIEYWTGFFASRSRVALPEWYSSLTPIFILGVLFVFLLFFKDMVRVWLRPYQHVREQFALLGLGSVTTFALLTSISIVSQQMPWQTISFVIFGNVAKNAPPWSEYAVLFLILGVLIISAFYGYTYWSGAISIEEFRRRQKGNRPNIVIDARSTLQRIIKRLPPLQIYSPEHIEKYQSQLEPVVYSLAWKDQAVELLRLTTTSYVFDMDADWYDHFGCWAGVNIDTNGLVILFPRQQNVTREDISLFKRYAKQLKSSKKVKDAEIVVAFKHKENGSNYVEYEDDFRFETEESLLDEIVNFNDYRNEIRKKVKFINLPESNLTLEDIYVPSSFTLPNGEESSDDIEAYLKNWLIEPSKRQLALLGEYGQGKSTATLMLTYHLLFQEDSICDRIPILIELRGMSPRNLTPLKLLGAWAAQYNINPRALMKLHIAGRLLLIFEGFDEMALVGDSQLRLKHFNTLWQFSYPKAKILITGRPNFFLDEEELKASLGISRPVGDRPYCEALRLVPFSVDKIERSLRSQPTFVRQQIADLAKHNPRFREMVSRPSLLHIVSVLWEREKLADKVEKLNSAYIMDLFVRYSYRRQGLKEADSPGFMALTTSEREFFMNGIAAYMAANDLPNQISGNQLNDAIECLIEAIPESVSTEAPRILGETTIPLQIRLKDNEYGLEHVKTDVRTCGLLVDDLASPGSFKFGHKSFMEYLFAVVVFNAIDNKKAEEVPVLMSTAGAQISDILELPVSIDFLAEMVSMNIEKIGEENKEQSNTAKILGDKQFALSLVEVLFNTQSKTKYYLLRWILFSVAYNKSGQHLKMYHRLLLKFVDPTIMIILAMLIPTALYYIIADQLSLNSTGIAYLLFLISYLLCLSTLFFLIMIRASYRTKMELWNHICKRVGVSDSALHIVAGTQWLPWARSREFDFLLRKNQTENEQNNEAA